MELKDDQSRALTDLAACLGVLDSSPDLALAFKDYRAAKGVRVGTTAGHAGTASYQNTVPGVPHVCAKVISAGGKTFVAVNALATVFSALAKRSPRRPRRPRLAVWRVPSLTIFDQTVRTLGSPEHPYGQRLDQLFQHRVAGFEKRDLLTGAGFSQDAAAAALHPGAQRGFFEAEQPHQLFEREELLKELRLSQADLTISFEDVETEVYRVDLERLGDEDYAPRAFKLAVRERDRERLSDYLLALPLESQVMNVVSRLTELTGNLYPVTDPEIKACILRAVTGSDSELKLKLGKLWETKAGRGYGYMMVFENNAVDGCERLADALAKIKQL